VSTFSIAIRTVPARRALFSDLLFYRLRSAPYHDGFRGLHVSGDARIAPNENACRALEAAANDDAAWVLFLEDDAGPIDDFFGSTMRWLGDHGDRNVHLYPLAHQYAQLHDRDFWDYPIANYYCSVAFAIKSVWVPSAVQYLRDNSHVRQGLDLMLGHWHRTVSTSAHFIAPTTCFVEHLGDESTLIDGRPARNVVGRLRNFRGCDFIYR